MNVISPEMSLRILTPMGKQLNRTVRRVRLTGILGSFEVRPGHEPLIAGLAPGTVEFTCEVGAGAGRERVTELLGIPGGTVEVNPGSVLVLAEDLIEPGDIPGAFLEKYGAIPEHQVEADSLGDRVENLTRYRLAFNCLTKNYQ